MIPKVIHYCWFGGNPLPSSAIKCIKSWRKFFPGYEIKEWNETNFDVNFIPYTAEAFSAKKYAFVSDVARYWVLYNYGGIYFDTDVEVLRPLDDILAKGAFMGREAGTNGKVAPGLGLASEKGHPLYKDILEEYSSMHFIGQDGSFNQKTIVSYTTELLQTRGLLLEDVFQEVEGIGIYPSEYFCPMDSTTGIVRLTERTYSIHHYDCSWLDHDTFRWRLHILKNSLNRFLFRLHLINP